jgi:hypothetical protein
MVQVEGLVGVKPALTAHASCRVPAQVAVARGHLAFASLTLPRRWSRLGIVASRRWFKWKGWRE